MRSHQHSEAVKVNCTFSHHSFHNVSLHVCQILVTTHVEQMVQQQELKILTANVCSPAGSPSSFSKDAAQLATLRLGSSACSNSTPGSWHSCCKQTQQNTTICINMNTCATKIIKQAEIVLTVYGLKVGA
jgi:hypothetical protein